MGVLATVDTGAGSVAWAEAVQEEADASVVVLALGFRPVTKHQSVGDERLIEIVGGEVGTQYTRPMCLVDQSDTGGGGRIPLCSDTHGVGVGHEEDVDCCRFAVLQVSQVGHVGRESLPRVTGLTGSFQDWLHLGSDEFVDD